MRRIHADWYLAPPTAFSRNPERGRGEPEQSGARGDHIYKMNYHTMISWHRSMGRVTLATIQVSPRRPPFWIVEMDAEHRVWGSRKNRNTATRPLDLQSVDGQRFDGVYLINTEVMLRTLRGCRGSQFQPRFRP